MNLNKHPIGTVFVFQCPCGLAFTVDAGLPQIKVGPTGIESSGFFVGPELA